MVQTVGPLCYCLVDFISMGTMLASSRLAASDSLADQLMPLAVNCATKVEALEMVSFTALLRPAVMCKTDNTGAV